jgi:hypothetical protein
MLGRKVVDVETGIDKRGCCIQKLEPHLWLGQGVANANFVTAHILLSQQVLVSKVLNHVSSKKGVRLYCTASEYLCENRL